MINKNSFDNDLYVEEQSAEILKRVEKYNNRLYLEFGGKLLYDYHAVRVLPGYEPNVKIRLLQKASSIARYESRVRRPLA